MYLSVVKGEEENNANEDMKKEVRRQIENCEDEELIFLLGDFNGHIGILRNQHINYNRKLVMDINTECDLILLNSTEKCDGTYTSTWSRGDQRSAIDFVINTPEEIRATGPDNIKENYTLHYIKTTYAPGNYTTY